jgi:transposase-like protein
MAKRQKFLITDALSSHSSACEQVFDGTKHIRQIRLQGKIHNNNKMERMNGEIRDREKNHARIKAQKNANPLWIPNLPQLHKTTRSIKR